MRPRRSGSVLLAPLAIVLLAVPLLCGCAASRSGEKAAAASAAGAAKPGGRARLAGRVTYRGAPVPDARVALYDRYKPTEKRAVRKISCGDDGGFKATVPAGSYFIEAEGDFEKTPVFAFSGQNPVRLETGDRWLGLKAVPRSAADAAPGPPERGAIVEGSVLFGGVPVEDAYVYVYSSPESLFKGMGIAMSAPTGRDGTFSIENLPESAYYLVARRRGAGGMTGPLSKGDLYGFFPGNPVYLKDRTVTRVRIETVEKEKALSYAEVTSGTEIALRGRVVDKNGAPQEGVYAFVYDNRVFGHQRPYGHSGRTGPDGSFAIYLDRPGVFYLGARENFGNSPAPGERFGFYGGTPDHAVTVEEAKSVDGLMIVVEPILSEAK